MKPEDLNTCSHVPIGNEDLNTCTFGNGNLNIYNVIYVPYILKKRWETTKKYFIHWITVNSKQDLIDT